jgi:hypothetical protein
MGAASAHFIFNRPIWWACFLHQEAYRILRTQGGLEMQMTPGQWLVLAALMMFLVGLLTFITGAIILVLRSRDREMDALTAQTSQLVNKGLAEDVAGLVGNASALLNAMNDLARTQNGIGIILLVTGALLMLISCFFLWYITYKAPFL